jgi:L-histidine N-alpha-methyltransferase
VSNDAIEKSASILLMEYPGIKIHGIVADFISQLNVLPSDTKKIICLLGSTIGNFSLEKALQFLTDLSNIMHTGDILLLGFDMVKNKEILEKAYNDKHKITEQFNKNILRVVNNHIGTDFDPDKFDHIAFYNEEYSRIEMHLKALEDVEIYCPHPPMTISIKEGETIHTENSHKFTNEHITWLASGADLDISKIYTDVKNWFSLVYLIKN